jgi:hypothetical protein
MAVYLAADSLAEAIEWVSVLRGIADSSVMRRTHFHPGVFRKDRWTCCRDPDMVGCVMVMMMMVVMVCACVMVCLSMVCVSVRCA